MPQLGENGIPVSQCLSCIEQDQHGEYADSHDQNDDIQVKTGLPLRKGDDP